MDPGIAACQRVLDGLGARIVPEWLPECVAFLREEVQADNAALPQLVKDQLLSGDLAEYGEPTLPAEVDLERAPSFPTSGNPAEKVLLQVVEVTEIGHSLNSMLRLVEDEIERRRFGGLPKIDIVADEQEDGGDGGDELDVGRLRQSQRSGNNQQMGGRANPNFNPNENLPAVPTLFNPREPVTFPRGTLRLTLTDGHRTVTALELERVPALNCWTPKGCKIALTRTSVHHSVLLLTPRSVQILGNAAQPVVPGTEDEVAMEFLKRMSQELREKMGVGVPQLAPFNPSLSAANPPNPPSQPPFPPPASADPLQPQHGVRRTQRSPLAQTADLRSLNGAPTRPTDSTNVRPLTTSYHLPSRGPSSSLDDPDLALDDSLDFDPDEVVAAVAAGRPFGGTSLTYTSESTAVPRPSARSDQHATPAGRWGHMSSGRTAVNPSVASPATAAAHSAARPPVAGHSGAGGIRGAGSAVEDPYYDFDDFDVDLDLLPDLDSPPGRIAAPPERVAPSTTISDSVPVPPTRSTRFAPPTSLPSTFEAVPPLAPAPPPRIPLVPPESDDDLDLAQPWLRAEERNMILRAGSSPKAERVLGVRSGAGAGSTVMTTRGAAANGAQPIAGVSAESTAAVPLPGEEWEKWEWEGEGENASGWDFGWNYGLDEAVHADVGGMGGAQGDAGEVGRKARNQSRDAGAEGMQQEMEDGYRDGTEDYMDVGYRDSEGEPLDEMNAEWEPADDGWWDAAENVVESTESEEGHGDAKPTEMDLPGEKSSRMSPTRRRSTSKSGHHPSREPNITHVARPPHSRSFTDNQKGRDMDFDLDVGLDLDEEVLELDIELGLNAARPKRPMAAEPVSPDSSKVTLRPKARTGGVSSSLLKRREVPTAPPLRFADGAIILDSDSDIDESNVSARRPHLAGRDGDVGSRGAKKGQKLLVPQLSRTQFKRGNVVLSVTVVKHADTGVSSSRPRTLLGQSESQLSSRGIKQAAIVSQNLKKTEWDAVYCSDSWQSKQTAVELTKLVPGAQIIYEPRLRERNLGDLTGLSWAEAKARLNEESKLFEEFIQDNGGESGTEFEDRVLDFYADLVSRHLLGPSGFPLSREGSTDLTADEKDVGKATPRSSNSHLAALSPNDAQTGGHYKAISMGGTVSDSDARRMSAVLPSPVRTTSSVGMQVPSSFVGRRASHHHGLSNSNGTSSGAMPTGPLSPAQAAATYAARKSHSGAAGLVPQSASASKVENAMKSPSSVTNTGKQAHPLPPRRVNVLLYTHGGVIQALFSHLLNELSFDLDSELQPGFPKDCSIYQFQINRVRTDVHGDWEWVGHVTAMNRASHYGLVPIYKTPEQIKAEGAQKKQKNLAEGKSNRKQISTQGAVGVKSPAQGSPSVFKRIQAAFQSNGAKTAGMGSPGATPAASMPRSLSQSSMTSKTNSSPGKILPPLPTTAK
ncbi:hypothetical protein HDU93_001638 [Gonapodya sp. JEL0774]|nr:hypothetical protein HDU93_001638 [Gonapodya sp. JEL0774]